MEGAAEAATEEAGGAVAGVVTVNENGIPLADCPKTFPAKIKVKIIAAMLIG